MNKAYLLIGGNIGNRWQHLQQAIAGLENKAGTVVQQSAIYETAAWGKTDQQPFLNQALLLHTALLPQALLVVLLATEAAIGRQRTEKYGPRTIDIDILLYNDAIINEPNLVVPHPHLPYRRFALAPLNDIAATLVHPVLHKTMHQLLEDCPDTLEVKKLAHT